MGRRLAAAALAVLALAACGPTPGPTGPRWVSTRLARVATPDVTVNRMGAWTSDEWFATLEVETPTGPGPSTNRLHFFPRTGPNGSTLGAPQVVTPAPNGFSGPLGGERIVAVGDQVLTFYLETAGTWAEAGTLPLTPGYTAVAITDEWLAVRRVPGNPDLPGDGEVRIYALAIAGPTVDATLAATLGPDPAWPAPVREGFGKDVALDGDLVAVSTGGVPEPGPGAVRVFRATAGTWTPVRSLGGGPSDPGGFGNSIAVDDGPTVDRVAILTYDPLPVLRIHADTGAGLSVEQELRPDPGIPTPEFFGAAIGLDGTLLAVTADATTVPSAEPGHLPVKVGHVQMYRLRSTWTRESRVAVFPTPYDPDVIAAYPSRLRVSGDHVGVTVLVTYDPPPGCGFICFNIGFESWSLDRR